MYYHLFDLQNSEVMESGKNSNNREELKDGLLSYISVDFSENDRDWKIIKKMSVEEIAEMWEFAIQTTENKI